MEITLLSLFPEYFLGPFDESIIKQARKKGLLNIQHINIRDFSKDKHKKVDDRPYGGGPGMVLMAQPITDALAFARKAESKVICPSPQGARLTPAKCKELAQQEHLIFLCGHYEGIDERIIKNEVDEEISIGDFVLTNGCLATIVVIDSLVRFIPGILGNEMSALEDSFQEQLLDHPHFTRPEKFNGQEVPKELLEGDHQKIFQWRKNQVIEKTKNVRPDLYFQYLKSIDTHKKSIEAQSFNFKKLTLYVASLKESIKFYKKIFSFTEDCSQIIVGQVIIELKESVIKLQNSSAHLELQTNDFEVLSSISKKLQGSSFLVMESMDSVTFKDLDDNFWTIFL